MIKKLIAVFASVSLIASLAVSPAMAQNNLDDTTYVTYEYPLNANEIRYDTNPSDCWGVNLVMQNSVSNSMWGPIAAAADNKSDWTKFTGWGWTQDLLTQKGYTLTSGEDTRRPSVRVSQRFVNNGELLNLDFTKDTYHADSGFDFNSSENYLIDLDFGAVLRSGDFLIEFTDDSDEAFATLRMTYNGTNENYTAKMESGSSKSVSLPQDGKTGAVSSMANLKLFVDMANQTYSAWLVKVADSSTQYGTVSQSASTLIVSEAPFETAADKMTKLRVTRENSSTSDRVDLFRLAISQLSDADIVSTAKNELSIPSSVQEDIALPAAYAGADITWSSSDDTVISNDGKVTPAAEEKEIELTANISRGIESDSKVFTVIVPAAYIPDPVPEDGIWVNDDMNYASAEDIPLIQNEKYGFEFDKAEAGADTSITSSGAVYSTDGSSLTLLKTKSSSSGALYKYLAPANEQMFDGQQIVEYYMEVIGKPEIYVALEQYAYWKGIQTIQLTTEQKISPYTADSIAAPQKIKITVITDGTTKTMDIYLNDKLQWDNISYRTKWFKENDGMDNFGRIQFSVGANSPEGSGMKLDYVRVFENAQYYGDYCLNNEATTITDTSVAADVESISLPSSGEYNNSITWNSSDNTVIDEQGQVTHKTEEKVITLTPTYINNVTGNSKEGVPVQVTVAARQKTTTEYAQPEAIIPETDGKEQMAVGFAQDFILEENGYTPEFGFKLGYEGKSEKVVTVPVNVEGADNTVRCGIIITYTPEDGFDMAKLTVTPYITQ